MMRCKVFLHGIEQFAEAELRKENRTGDFTLDILTLDKTRYECLDHFSQWLYLLHPPSFSMAIPTPHAYILRQHAKFEHSLLVWTLTVNYLLSSCDLVGVQAEPRQIKLRFSRAPKTRITPAY